MRHIVVGDVHGCLVELEMLLSKLSINKDDCLYFIGDLIDKGPYSVEVVRRVFDLSKSNDVKLILGNHEEKFLRFVRKKNGNTNALINISNVENYQIFYSKLSLEEITFLQKSYLYYRIPMTNSLLVHAGIPDNFQIDDYAYLSDFSGAFLKKMRLLTMTRMLNSKGKFLSMNDSCIDMYYWAEKYDGKHGAVVFGHQAFTGHSPKIFPNAIGIDTGCVYGGALSAYIIEDGKSHFVIIPALKKYCYDQY